MELIYEKSQAGRRAGRVPNYGLPVPESCSASILPSVPS